MNMFSRENLTILTNLRNNYMNKTLALIALLGLISAPAFANEAAKAPAAPAVHADKVVAKEGKAKAATAIEDEAAGDESEAEHNK
jgi:hypothetical protein